jgi:hypothetical protein
VIERYTLGLVGLALTFNGFGNLLYQALNLRFTEFGQGHLAL